MYPGICGLQKRIESSRFVEADGADEADEADEKTRGLKHNNNWTNILSRTVEAQWSLAVRSGNS